MKMEMKRRNGKRKKNDRNFISSPLISLVYIKRKSKVKNNFDFGEKLHKYPPTSPNHQNQSHSLVICSIQSFFPQVLLTNSSIVKLHIYPYRVSRNLPHQLHKISIDTQTHLINFYYCLHFDLRNLIKFHKLEGLTLPDARNP